MNAKACFGGMSLNACLPAGRGKPVERRKRDNPEEYGEIIEENFSIC